MKATLALVCVLFVLSHAQFQQALNFANTARQGLQLGSSIANGAMAATQGGLQLGASLAGSNPNAQRGLNTAAGVLGAVNQGVTGGLQGVASAAESGDPIRLGSSIANTALSATQGGLAAGAAGAQNPDAQRGLNTAAGVLGAVDRGVTGGLQGVSNAVQARDPLQLGTSIADTALSATQGGLAAGAAGAQNPNVQQGLNTAAGVVGAVDRGIQGVSAGQFGNVAQTQPNPQTGTENGAQNILGNVARNQGPANAAEAENGVGLGNSVANAAQNGLQQAVGAAQDAGSGAQRGLQLATGVVGAAGNGVANGLNGVAGAVQSGDPVRVASSITDTALSATQGGLAAGAAGAQNPNVQRGLNTAAGVLGAVDRGVTGGLQGVSNAVQSRDPIQLGSSIADTALSATQGGLAAGAAGAQNPNVQRGLNTAAGVLGAVDRGVTGGLQGVSAAAQSGNPLQLGTAISQTALGATQGGLAAGAAGAAGNEAVQGGLNIASNAVGAVGSGIGNIANAAQSGNGVALGTEIANTALSSTRNGLLGGSALAGRLGNRNAQAGLNVASGALDGANSAVRTIGGLFQRPRAITEEEINEELYYAALADAEETLYEYAAAFDADSAVSDAQADLAIASQPLPGYVVTLIVLGALVAVALVAVMIQLVFFLRNQSPRKTVETV